MIRDWLCVYVRSLSCIEISSLSETVQTLLRPKFKLYMFVNVLVAAASATTTFFVSRRKSRRNGENKTNFEQVCTRKRFLLSNETRNKTFLAGKNFKM